MYAHAAYNLNGNFLFKYYVCKNRRQNKQCSIEASIQQALVRSSAEEEAAGVKPAADATTHTPSIRSKLSCFTQPKHAPAATLYYIILLQRRNTHTNKKHSQNAGTAASREMPTHFGAFYAHYGTQNLLSPGALKFDRALVLTDLPTPPLVWSNWPWSLPSL